MWKNPIVGFFSLIALLATVVGGVAIGAQAYQAVNGSAVTSQSTMRGALGSVTAPTFSFTGDTNTGVYSSGADTLDFATAGTQRMSVASNGAVGIGGPAVSTGLLSLTGTFPERRGLAVLGRLQPPANASALSAYIATFIDTAATGTHGALGALRVDAPTVTSGGAAVTDAYTVLIVGAPTIGSSSNYALRVTSGTSRFEGVLSLGSVAEPTCNAANRGVLAMVQGGGGVADTVRICTKDAADAYAYRALY